MEGRRKKKVRQKEIRNRRSDGGRGHHDARAWLGYLILFPQQLHLLNLIAPVDEPIYQEDPFTLKRGAACKK